jgi:hypothetical protein
LNEEDGIFTAEALRTERLAEIIQPSASLGALRASAVNPTDITFK